MKVINIYLLAVKHYILGMCDWQFEISDDWPEDKIISSWTVTVNVVDVIDIHDSFYIPHKKSSRKFYFLFFFSLSHIRNMCCIWDIFTYNDSQ